MPLISVFKFINWITGTPVPIEDAVNSALTAPLPTDLAATVQSLITADLLAALSANNIFSFQSSEVTFANRFAVTSNLQSVLTSLPLVAGTYLLGGNVGFLTSGGGQSGRARVDVGVGSTTMETPPAGGSSHDLTLTFAVNSQAVMPVGIRRVVVSAPDTAYLRFENDFIGGPCAAFGFLWTLRVG